jgi:hypothetical protein
MAIALAFVVAPMIKLPGIICGLNLSPIALRLHHPIFIPVIELGIAPSISPTVDYLPIAWGLSTIIGEVSYDELVVCIGPMAHHAGCLMRIHWDQAHSARGVVTHVDIGQGLMYCPIGQRRNTIGIELCLGELLIADACKRCRLRSHRPRLYLDGV